MTTFRTEFELRGEPRRINSDAVDQLDHAVAAAAGVDISRLMHGIDPRRLLTFKDGGPPVWIVAQCPCANGDALSVTYGLSRFIDPASSFDHEMSIRVPGNGTPTGPAWPMFFLRQLARYQLTSGRELRAGEVMPFGESITRAAMGPEHKASMPDSEMRAIAVVNDPLMQSVRRVYGLFPEELVLSEKWSAAGMMSLIAQRDPCVTTSIARESHIDDDVILQGVREGGLEEGSATGAAVVEGIRWHQDADAFVVDFPAGTAKRIVDLIDGRLPFKRNILLHDMVPAPQSEVAFVPSDGDWAQPRSDAMLEIGVAGGSMLLMGLRMAAREATPSAVSLRLRKP